ncbi:GTP-binding protein [Amycolatopsis pigmentata]|uniref:ATP/GTP-binding protein n=1 Tax=Amycolatopsis pigmentata TaxID=450801 RepID=A0ABW5FPI5_9PSEU
MDSTATGALRPPLPPGTADTAKIVIVGGTGVGKTTMVSSVSEIDPLSTEETFTPAGETGVAAEGTTTVAFDFGRITLNDELVLYLFGAPGQESFPSFWDQLFTAALGAIVLVDTRRVTDSWYAIDRLEHHGTPFVVARNTFPGTRHDLAGVREALTLPGHIPLVDCDARKRESCKQVLLTLVNHLYAGFAPKIAP